jgi:hypothetical protein
MVTSFLGLLIMGASAAVAVAWFSIRQYVRYLVKSRFDEKLADYEHKMEMIRLQKSLSYENQSRAFQTILNGLQEVIKQFEQSYDDRNEVFDPVPSGVHQKFLETCRSASLFLDEECLQSAAICSSTIWMGTSRSPDPNENPHNKECYAAYDGCIFLLGKLSTLFHKKIGFQIDNDPYLEIVIFGSILKINRSRVDETSPKNTLFRMRRQNGSEAYVEAGLENMKELAEEVEDCLKELEEDSDSKQFFAESRLELKAILKKLTQKMK